MAVKIRLRRMGSRNAPFYRVIAQDSRYAPTGRFIETLGWYDPKQDGNNFSLNIDRVDYWLGNGAQPSETANSLIIKARAMFEEDVAVAPIRILALRSRKHWVSPASALRTGRNRNP